MGATLPQAARSIKSAGALSRWLSTFTVQAPADPAMLSNWLAENREMRARASALAEKPPLLSY